jgi:hypothetical protein
LVSLITLWGNQRPAPTSDQLAMAALVALYPEGTKVTNVTSGGRRKMHYTLPDESEVVEEYDVQTDELVVRKKRSKTVLGAEGEWIYEVGEAPTRVTIENDLLRPNSSNPLLVRKDRPHAFEWRIRNLPYPKPTYAVTVDAQDNQIVVRTSNKKYFKRIDIPEMDRLRLHLEEAALSWSHENSTLIIQYKKPQQIMAAEKDAKVARLTAPEQGPEQAAEEQCKQQ